MNFLFDKWFIRHIQLVKCHWEFHISVKTCVITVKWKMSCKMRQRHISFVMFVHLQKLFLWKWNRVWHSFNKKNQNIISILCHYLFDEYMLTSTQINNCLKKKTLKTCSKFWPNFFGLNDTKLCHNLSNNFNIKIHVLLNYPM